MRALLLILDGVGCGSAPDAAAFGDEGASTLGNIFHTVPELSLPALFSLGLWKLLTADVFDPRSQGTQGRWGRMRPASPGKDSVTGHWELAGVIVDRPFATIEDVVKPFIAAVEADAKVKFIASRRGPASLALETAGKRHFENGEFILSFDQDSIVEIAAHESVHSSSRLHDVCRIARRHANTLRIARVVARPLSGQPEKLRYSPGGREYGIVPPRTVLNAITETGLPVHGIGKVGDLFGGSGITKSTSATSNAGCFAEIDRAWDAGADGLVFANLADFDALGGHKRDPLAYASLLMEFDDWIGSLLPHIEPEDLVIITADHGNDPTYRGTAHTREETPLLVLHGSEAGPLGTRRTFADIAATFSEFFQLRQRWPVGESFLRAPGTPVPKRQKRR